MTLHSTFLCLFDMKAFKEEFRKALEQTEVLIIEREVRIL